MHKTYPSKVLSKKVFIYLERITFYKYIIDLNSGVSVLKFPPDAFKRPSIYNESETNAFVKSLTDSLEIDDKEPFPDLFKVN